MRETGKPWYRTKESSNLISSVTRSLPLAKQKAGIKSKMSHLPGLSWISWIFLGLLGLPLSKIFILAVTLASAWWLAVVVLYNGCDLVGYSPKLPPKQIIVPWLGAKAKEPRSTRHSKVWLSAMVHFSD